MSVIIRRGQISNYFATELHLFVEIAGVAFSGLSVQDLISSSYRMVLPWGFSSASFALGAPC